MQNMAIIYNFCLHSGKKIVLIRTIIIIPCVTMMSQDICNRETKCPIQLCLHEDNNNFNN